MERVYRVLFLVCKCGVATQSRVGPREDGCDDSMRVHAAAVARLDVTKSQFLRTALAATSSDEQGKENCEDK